MLLVAIFFGGNNYSALSCSEKCSFDALWKDFGPREICSPYFCACEVARTFIMSAFSSCMHLKVCVGNRLESTDQSCIRIAQLGYRNLVLGLVVRS